MFIIEDELHAEPQQGEFTSFEQAVAELKERAKIPWNQKPNRCPCISWKICERQYQIVEYDNTTIPWTELSRQHILTISSKGIKWEEKIIAEYNIV